MFYSASIGANLHITMMNTEAEIDWPKMDRAQHTWIEADVAAARTAKPHGWVVAAGHRPLYCSNPGNKIQCAAFADILRVVLEPLFTSPRTFVDLVIQSSAGLRFTHNRQLELACSKPCHASITCSSGSGYIIY